MLREGMTALLVTIISSALLIILSILYFGITIWIIKIAAQLFYGVTPDVNWAVLGATLLSAGVIISGALEHKRRR